MTLIVTSHDKCMFKSVLWPYLITGLDCGLDCMTGLMNWITEFIFVHVTWPLAHQRVDRSHVCNSMYNGLFTSVTIMVAPLKMDIARVCFTQHSKIRMHAEKSLVKCSIGFEMAAIVYVRSSIAMARSVRGLGISPWPFAPTFPRKFSTWVLPNALMHVKADYCCAYVPHRWSSLS